MSTSYTPNFKPTSKRRSFRPGNFRPLHAQHPPSLSTLSENLRASLMNVGMRVRKSVPEGYKTTGSKADFDIYEQTVASHPELSTFAGDARKPLLPPVQLSAGSSYRTGGGVGSVVAVVEDENEMTDEQVAATVDDVLTSLNADLEGWGDGGGGISSSQESNASTVSNTSSVRGRGPPPRRRKRGPLHDDEEDDEFNIWGGGGVPMERDVPLRQIAQPRSRRPQIRRNGSSSSSAGKGDRKSVKFASFTPDGDFGEADFLMPDTS